MLRILLVVLFSTLSITVSAASTTAQCSRVDLAYLALSVTHPEYFCGFWLSAPRTDSAFKNFNAKRTTSTCKCAAKSTTSSKMLARGQQTEVQRKKATYAPGCPTADIKTVKSEIADEMTFCAFFMKQAYTQPRKPFQKLSVARTTAACKCINGAKGGGIIAASPVAAATTSAKTG
ncbi:Hypothetical protein D9617_4g000990 [Elsinoe fawcettii]|nr:Hypothetical protein D9617_4g000990 [Elsinoe fawcettii]